MSISKSIIITLCFMLFVIFCAREVKKAEVVQPEGVNRRRIEFVKTLSTLEDFGFKFSFFKRIWQGIVGKKNQGIFSFPMDIAFYKDEMVAITDQGLHGVHLINKKKNSYKLIMHACGRELISPLSCEFVDEDTLAITDPGNKLLCFIDLKNGNDIEAKIELLNPVGIAVDSDQNILLVDSHLHLLFKIDHNGREIWRKGGRGDRDENLNFPTFVEFSNDKIFIVDTLSYAIKIFDREGNFISKFGRAGDGLGDFGKPKGIGVDIYGNIYVVDSLFDVVQVFDISGNLLSWFGGSGEDEGHLLHPEGIEIRDHEIFVVNSMNSRIEVFRYVE